MKVMTNSKNIDQELMWRLSGGWCAKLIKVTVFKGKIAEVEGPMEKKENQAILDTTVRAASFWISLDFSRNLRTTFSMKVVFLPSSMCSLRFPFGFPLDSLLFKKNSIRCWNRHPELYRDSSTSHEKRSQLKVSTFGHCEALRVAKNGWLPPPQKKLSRRSGRLQNIQNIWKALKSHAFPVHCGSGRWPRWTGESGRTDPMDQGEVIETHAAPRN